MDPLNNQPNSLFVCKVGTFSIESRLNIGPRVGTGREGGCHRSGIVFSLGDQHSTSPEQVATLSSLGTDWCFCLTRGSFAHFTLLSLFDGACLFRAAVLEYLYSVSTQATVSALKRLMPAGCH